MKLPLAVPQMFLALGYAVVVSVIAKAPTLWITAIFIVPSAGHRCLRIDYVLAARIQRVKYRALSRARGAEHQPYLVNRSADTISDFAGKWTDGFADFASICALR